MPPTCHRNCSPRRGHLLPSAPYDVPRTSGFSSGVSLFPDFWQMTGVLHLAANCLRECVVRVQLASIFIGRVTVLIVQPPAC